MFTGAASHLHFARLALWEFQEKNGRLPKLHDEAEADQVVAIAEEILKKHKEIADAITVEELDKAVVKNYALYATTGMTNLTLVTYFGN